MSQRHRESRAAVPGYERVTKNERRRDHRRERQAAKAALLQTDPDAVVMPTVRTTGGEHAPAPAASVARRRFRHWKSRFWKRRTALRHERNQALQRLNEDQD